MDTHQIISISPRDAERLFSDLGTMEHRPQTLEEQIREEYARRHVQVREKHKSAVGGVKMRFTDHAYPWPANAYKVECALRAAGVMLAHQWPSMNYFLTFADLHQNFAILVEEKESPWHRDPHGVAFQDYILTTLGWHVYRISDTVANTNEADLLPEHLHETARGNYIDERTQMEYEAARPRLAMLTVDGFAHHLRNLRYQYRRKNPALQMPPLSTVRDSLARRQTPEQEAEALLYGADVETLTQDSPAAAPRAAFETWARGKGLKLAAYHNSGQYMCYRTNDAWKVWQAATQAATVSGWTPPSFEGDHADFGPVP